MKKILFYNTNLKKKDQVNFNNIIAPRISFDVPYDIIELKDQISNIEDYSHLILSGSELSASQGSKYDSSIINTINLFVKKRRAILGICHGHQMLAIALSKKENCIKANPPGFGWNKFTTTDNFLFKDITNKTFLLSHYDIIIKLPKNFKIIASNQDHKIQAFQYENKPIYGVQFHPEVLLEDGNIMIENHLKNNQQDKKFYKNELTNKKNTNENLKIFKNFLQIEV